MREPTTTIRISKKVKKKFDDIKGKVSYTRFIDYLLDYFMGNTK